MATDKKNTFIRVRVSPELHEAWVKACEKNAQNGSALLRNYIKDYIVKAGFQAED